MGKYKTATFAAKYVWNTFENPNENKKEYVLSLLESYINRKLDEKGCVNLWFISPGNIDLVSKNCSQEATVFNARYFDLRITKENVIDSYDKYETVFEDNDEKTQGSK